MGKCLVTAAQTALAYKVKAILLPQEVVLGDFLPLPALGSLTELPNPASGVYIHEFLKAALALSADWVFPLRRAEAAALQSSAALFAEYGLALALPEELDLATCPVYQPDAAKEIFLQEDGLFWRDEQGNAYFLLVD